MSPEDIRMCSPLSPAPQMAEADLDWANLMLDKVPPHKQAIRSFDSSALGMRYLRLVGMTMWENLGGDSLPADAAELAESI